MGSICHCSSFVWNEQVWTTISCSHLLSSLTVHCSYRLKFFVVRLRNHLWDGNSLPQLQSSCGFVPLEALEGLSTQRVWHGASQREDRASPECEEVRYFFFFWAQFSRELARLYEYSYWAQFIFIRYSYTKYARYTLGRIVCMVFRSCLWCNGLDLVL